MVNVPEKMPFAYPEGDETPYLRWFDGQFQPVFVAFNPSLRVPGFAPSDFGEPVPEEYEIDAKRCGAKCGVSRSDIAKLCGFPSIRYVNKALRLTGSRRIAPEYADPESTSKLLSLCKEKGILLPDEGYASPLLELSMGRFLSTLGHSKVVTASHFGVDPCLIQSGALSGDSENVALVELCSEDFSLYVTIYIDYHYHLICQTDAGLKSARPEDFFEGFYADADTNDFWGIGDLS
ncbi:MAG: hypothetical protein GY807_19560 [Gammaproteobacteria bacterium]|nr:hypothetical protein [Gammaproteobacteria bacterium]